VAFTLRPQTNDARDNARLKELIRRIYSTTKTPTMVLATNSDSLGGQNEFSNAKQNISDSLRVLDAPYPQEATFVVSGKQKYLGDKGLEYATRFKKVPDLEDPDPSVKKFAEDWANTVGFGDSEKDKREYYSDLTPNLFIKRCQKLIEGLQT